MPQSIHKLIRTHDKLHMITFVLIRTHDKVHMITKHKTHTYSDLPEANGPVHQHWCNTANESGTHRASADISIFGAISFFSPSLRLAALGSIALYGYVEVCLWHRSMNPGVYIAHCASCSTM
jgi:hypothetical protein